MAYRRVSEGMRQTAIWLPVDLRDELRQVGGKKGIGRELRRRLAEWKLLHEAGYRVVQQPVITKEDA